jgi:16S rRNA (guanine527-N7)-methyltransferase
MRGNPRTDTGRVTAALADLVERFSPGLDPYLEELLKWNPQLGLFSKRDPERILTKLLRQSVALWDFTCEARGGAPARAVDVGTGGGFPGLVWKLLAPALEVVLVERKARKADFLDRVAHRLGRPEGLAVAAEDVTAFARHRSRAGAFDVAALMAVAPAPGVLQALDRVLTPGGAVVTVRPAGQNAAESGYGPAFMATSKLAVDGATLLFLERS